MLGDVGVSNSFRSTPTLVILSVGKAALDAAAEAVVVAVENVAWCTETEAVETAAKSLPSPVPYTSAVNVEPDSVVFRMPTG